MPDTPATLTMPRKLFGYLPDPHDPRDFKFGALGLTGDPPESASLRPYAGPILAQANNDCVAHALAYAELDEQIRGASGVAEAATTALELAEKIGYASRRFLYWNARHYHQATDLDEGTHIRFGILGMEKLGFPPEKDWPYEAGNWMEQPNDLAYRDAIDQAGVEAYYRIDSIGASRVLDVRRAIANGWAVVWGTAVWQPLVDMQPGQIIAPTPELEVLGGHAMCCLEYDPESFRGPQSWGPGFGDAGWYAVTPSYFASDETRDVWAIKFGMRYAEGT